MLLYPDVFRRDCRAVICQLVHVAPLDIAAISGDGRVPDSGSLP